MTRTGTGSPTNGTDPATADSALMMRLFGAELLHWRELRGLSQEDLAVRLPHSRSRLWLVETACLWPTRALAERCDDALDTSGALSRLWPFVDEARQREKQSRLAAHMSTGLLAIEARDSRRKTERRQPPDTADGLPAVGTPATATDAAAGADPLHVLHVISAYQQHMPWWNGERVVCRCGLDWGDLCPVLEKRLTELGEEPPLTLESSHSPEPQS
jgi:transcriptional regulator with XRE-family HTH domain